jgi:hypothetical protein
MKIPFLLQLFKLLTFSDLNQQHETRQLVDSSSCLGSRFGGPLVLPQKSCEGIPPPRSKSLKTSLVNSQVLLQILFIDGRREGEKERERERERVTSVEEQELFSFLLSLLTFLKSRHLRVVL